MVIWRKKKSWCFFFWSLLPIVIIIIIIIIIIINIIIIIIIIIIILIIPSCSQPTFTSTHTVTVVICKECIFGSNYAVITTNYYSYIIWNHSNFYHSRLSIALL